MLTLHFPHLADVGGALIGENDGLFYYLPLCNCQCSYTPSFVAFFSLSIFIILGIFRSISLIMEFKLNYIDNIAILDV